MRSINSNDPFINVALQMRLAALALMKRSVPMPWCAREMLAGALASLQGTDAPERAEVETIIRGDLANAVRHNPTYVNAFVEQGAEGIFEVTLRQGAEKLGADHPALLYVRAQRAHMWAAKGKYWEADGEYGKVIQELEQRAESADLELLAEVLEGLADIQGRLNDLDAAAATFERAHFIRAKLR